MLRCNGSLKAAARGENPSCPDAIASLLESSLRHSQLVGRADIPTLSCTDAKHSICDDVVMIDLSEYRLETIRNDGEFILYRGQRQTDAIPSPVLVLTPISERPVPGSLARIEHEYSLTAHLDSGWFVSPIALAPYNGRTVLVLTHPGGEPLDRFIGTPLELTQFLRLAIGLSTAFGQLHGRRGLIHKNIKPANILVNQATGELRLTDFGIASRLPRERQAPGPSEVIAGTLAYMAPEQTGRMNRSVDAPSDLYSLSAALFCDENLSPLVICCMVNLSLEHGNSGGSCFAYVWFVIIAGPRGGSLE